MRRLSLLVIILLFLLLFGLFLNSGSAEPETGGQVVNALSEPVEGFARARGPQPLSFPADHGPHPDYQTEWWYYTGNLETDDGRHFGFQLTFFRRALVPPAERQERASDWAADQIYFAHFAVTDVDERRYESFERFARGAAGLAGAQSAPYRIWIEDWQAGQTGPDAYRLEASQDGMALALELRDVKGPILQGDQGYSQKGPDPGNASYYYSLTRLESSGTIEVGEAVYQVQGLSWMDHEFSTSALTEEQIGWDWFALQLDDRSELMVFQLRRTDGTIDPFSSGTYIAPDGAVHDLSREDFMIEVGGTWRSPRSGAIYPALWIITIPAIDLVLEMEPYLADQELDVSFTYWEGAVRIRGERDRLTVAGSGYVELTGYADQSANRPE